MRWLSSAGQSLRLHGRRRAKRHPLIELRDVSVEKYYGPRHVSLSIDDGEVLAVVGDPGPAQHIFLQLLAGTVDADEGQVDRRGDCRLACSWLTPDLPDFVKVGEFVSHPTVSAVGPNPDTQNSDATARRERRVDSAAVAAALAGLGGPGAHRHLHELDEAECHRVSLAAALVSDADLVILENPTRHLDISAIDWLGEHIAASVRSWVVSTHDRALIDRVAARVAVIERGAVTVHEGNYSALLHTAPSGETAADARTRCHREEELDRLEGSEKGPDPRRRVRDYPARQDAAQRRTYDFAGVQIPPGPPLDDTAVITADGVTKVWAHRPVVKDLSVEIERGAIVGVVGPRGCGKTTVLELLAGRQVPDSGTVTTGRSTRCAYAATGDLDRYRNATVWDAICGDRAFLAIGTHEISSRSVLEALGFHGRRQRAEGADLTSAERDRLRLALTITQGANVLILDDPTGGMEIDMLTALEDALLQFPGTVIISTHDRWLLERVATHTITPAPGSTVGLWEITDSGYQPDRASASERAHAHADTEEHLQ